MHMTRPLDCDAAERVSALQLAPDVLFVVGEQLGPCGIAELGGLRNGFHDGSSLRSLSGTTRAR